MKLALQTAGSDREQLGRRLEVMLGAQQVAVPQIGREPRQHPGEVPALMIPPLQAVHGHGVTQVVSGDRRDRRRA